MFSSKSSNTTTKRRRRDSNGSPENASDAECSSGTFEFDMEIVRDSESTSRRRGNKRSLQASNSDSCADPSIEMNTPSHGGPVHVEQCANPAEEHRPLIPIPETDADVSDDSFRTMADTMFSNGSGQVLTNRTIVFSLLIGTVGFVCSTLFLGMGISNAVNDSEVLFTIQADEITQDFERTFKQYITAARWVHHACSNVDMTRAQFRELYDYITLDLELETLQWTPKVLHKDRLAFEERSRAFFAEEYPDFNYIGIAGFETDSNGTTTLRYRAEQEYYYPIHLVEPIDYLNIYIIDFDTFAASLTRDSISLALETWQPTATRAFRLFMPDGNFTVDKYMRISHPGIPLKNVPNQTTKDVSTVRVRIRVILEKTVQGIDNDVSVFLYDSSDDLEEPEFLLGAEVYVRNQSDTGERIVYLEEISLAELVEETVLYTRINEIAVASRNWTIVTIALEDTFTPEINYIILAGKFILVASLCVSLWMLTNFRRTKTIIALKRKADLEKTAVIIKSARDNAKAEQELNDYIAHEVRNPLAAAISACTFVKVAVNERLPTLDIQAIRDDIDIIDSSLTFTNDLLRNMLDMHRAAKKTLFIDQAPLDVLQDVIEPVAAMFYTRGEQFEVLLECPRNLIVYSDRLRLKQIMLNLGRNSCRYVQKGYVRVGAHVMDGTVQLFVEDSGPGVSDARKQHLFSKFQERLEIMDQGSGVGLWLCKSMVDLLGGDIWLDDTFQSGVEGRPGSRFVIDLNKPPIQEWEHDKSIPEGSEHTDTASTNEDSTPKSESPQLVGDIVSADSAIKKSRSLEFARIEEGPDPDGKSTPEEQVNVRTEKVEMLPEKLRVLFVDDDMILRKLFMRSLRKLVATWEISEAASGEAALKAVDDQDFDIIFMDQYMASVERQLLGTETTLALRAKGVTCRICGLSANDTEQGFWSAGADCFLFKPFPCKKEELEKELLHILNAPRNPKVKQSEQAKDSEITPSS